MTRAKREPRVFTVAGIEESFELASYWLGQRFRPAVFKTERGFSIRVVKSASFSGRNRSYTYDYFEIDADGTITSAPHGYAKDWKPGRVTDIEAAVERYATPDPEAVRVL